MTQTRWMRPAMAAATLLTAAFLLAACAGGGTETDPGAGAASGALRSFEADNGTVEIPADPQRIVTLGSPGVFLDTGVAPVGMSVLDESFVPWLSAEQRQTYEAAADVAAAGGGIDYEKVAGLAPDLIVAHVPDAGWKNNFDEARLASIAPTVWIAIDNKRWKAQGARVADAVGETGLFNEQQAAYDALVAELGEEYGELLDSTSFAVVTRWAQTARGSFEREYAGSYCTTHLVDAGFDIPGEPSEGTTEFQSYSLERLTDLGEVDVIIYELGADGKPNPNLAPVLDSELWRALPAVKAGRAFGVRCSNVMTYGSKADGLQSVREALAALVAKSEGARR